MKLTDGYHDVPEGHIAAVVTHMEMRERPARPETALPDGVLLEPWFPDAPSYLALFREVGSPWLWFGRLRLAEAEAARIISDPNVDLYRLFHDGGVAGMLELDRRKAPEVEIAYMGLKADATGKGLGRILLNCAVDLGFDAGAAPLAVHTCTLDHPRALEAYLKAGFRAVRRSVEVAPDPRIDGLIPPGFHPWQPVI